MPRFARDTKRDGEGASAMNALAFSDGHSSSIATTGVSRSVPNGGMVIGMATTKITVTIPQEQVAEISSLVAAGRAPNVSAFVKHAISIALSDAAGWREMLNEALAQTGGPLTSKERAWADSIL